MHISWIFKNATKKYFKRIAQKADFKKLSALNFVKTLPQ